MNADTVGTGMLMAAFVLIFAFAFGIGVDDVVMYRELVKAALP